MMDRRGERRRAIKRHDRSIFVILVVGSLAAAGLSVTLAGGSPQADPAAKAGTVRIVTDDGLLQEASVAKLSGLARPRYERWLGAVPGMLRERRGLGRVTLRTDSEALADAVDAALSAGGGTVTVPTRPVAAKARLPVVRQALRNNCETAALAMLLAAHDVDIEQLELQEQLPQSGSLDPEPSPLSESSTWGDPEEGFVGRADGGGTSGGYGVYEGPITDLAERHGVSLADLSRESPRAIYRSLLDGRPVMVWVGLSDGPYQDWLAPDGHTVTGNFGEHTVVLTGIRGDELYLNDPLVGERTTWTRDYFEELWTRLDRRALGA